MKVLFVVSTFPALSETFILNQITGFIDAGHEVEILAMSEVYGKKHSDVDRYKLMEKVTFINHPKSFLKKIHKLMKIIIRNPFSTLRLLNFFYYGKFVFSFRPAFAQEYLKNQSDYDAIIAHYGSNGLLLSILEKSTPTKRFVFFHGNDLTGFVNRFNSNIYNALFKSDIMLLPISQLWAAKLRSYGASSLMVKVHHMGVDVNRFKLEKINNFEDPIKLLLIGRLTEKKGIDIAIASVRILKECGYPLKLTIIGDGDLNIELRKLVQALGLEKEVYFSGWVNQENVVKSIKQADIILQPSRTANNGDMEGIPVSLMESLAQGKLVVSTYHSGIPELIIDGHNGLLAPENNPVKFADKIEKFIQMTNDERHVVSINARSTILREFNIDKLNEKLIEMCLEK